MTYQRLIPLLRASACAVAVTFGSLAQAATVSLGNTGEAEAFSTTQPSLALTVSIDAVGVQGFGSVGRIQYFAGNFTPRGYLPADGRLLSIQGNEALYSRIGTTYGGDGRTTFRLPDLRQRTAVGTGNGVSLGQQVGADQVTLTEANMPAHSHGVETGQSSQTGAASPQAFENMQPGLGLDFEIVTTGTFPSRNLTDGQNPAQNNAQEDGTLGFVTIDADISGAELGMTNANGQIVDIRNNQALFSLLGTLHGGDGRTDFALPDTGGRIVVGAGNGPGLDDRIIGETGGSNSSVMTLDTMPTHSHDDPGGLNVDAAGGGQAISNIQEEIALNYLIAVEGIYPSRNLQFQPNLAQLNAGSIPFLGEVAMFAGNFAPRGWLFAHGQILSIAQNTALFSLLGTTYGGDGRSTFALPDLRGRTVVGAGDAADIAGSYQLGQLIGTEFLDLSAANLPAHAHLRVAVPLPAGFVLMLGGLGLLGAVSRRKAA